MMGNYTLNSNSSRICFASNGAIKYFCYTGKPLVRSASELFSLRFRRKDGSIISVSGRDFKRINFDDRSFRYSAHPGLNGLSVEIGIRDEDGFFYFRPAVRDIPDELVLELIDSPQIMVGKRGDLLHPRSEGGIIHHPEKHEYPEPEINDGEFYIDNYPGRCQMQFMAYMRDGKGLYFAAHDPAATPKRIIYSGENNGIRLRLETFCGQKNVSEYVSPFEYVLGGFDGDWMAACDIYRNWVETAFDLKPQADIPLWMHDSPITLIYPVCGDGTIKAEPNEYFPYIKGMKQVKRFAGLLDSRIMALLMRWDKNGPWLPPEIWPPLGGEALLLEFRDALHEAGHLLGLYGSGSAYTLKSYTNGYNATDEFIQKRLDQVMCRNADGSLCINEMTGIRTGHYMCMTEKYPREVIKAQILAMADAGIDFLQYFDQNLGCNNYLCYADDHHHVSTPGQWSTDSMRSFLADLTGELKARKRPMLLGTEGAAAEPYASALPFNDLRSSLYFGSRPIPAYHYVFHQYYNNFMGNQVHMTQCIDHRKTRHDLLFRIGYSFNAGMMLTVPMRENGLIDWGNDGDWSMPPPDQKSAIKLLKNLNRTRRDYPQFMESGRMVKPRIEISGGTYALYHIQRKIVFDDFFTSGWIAPDGSYGQMVVNFLPVSQKLNCHAPQDAGVKVGQKIYHRDFVLTIPALTAKVLFVEAKR